MKRGRMFLGAALALMAIGGCHRPSFLGGKPPAPTGQVVATVGNQEITLRQLQAELGGANITDPAQLKAAEQRALQMIIARTLVANAARSQGLDKTPDFAIQRQRATDALLANALQEKAAAVPEPSQDEIQRYITNNPDMFAQRKIWDVDQIRLLIPENTATLKPLAPLTTMDQVQSFLSSQHIDFNRGDATVDAASLDPRVIANILKLPANAIFIIPSGRFLLVNQIKSTRIVPMKTDVTSKYVAQLLKRQHMQRTVQNELGMVINQGEKTVQYSPAFRPPPNAKGTATPAPSAQGNAAAPG
jgi:EpsD family peptidyl-prolyl cis-trans isomerase